MDKEEREFWMSGEISTPSGPPDPPFLRTKPSQPTFRDFVTELNRTHPFPGAISPGT